MKSTNKQKNSLGAISPKTPTPIPLPEIEYISLDILNPAFDKIQGGAEGYRWRYKTQKERTAMKLHKSSFVQNGIMGAFPVVKIPETMIEKLDGKDFEYKKDTYMTVDYSGRLRTLKQMVNSGDYTITNVPIADSSEQILNGATTIGPNEMQNLWDATVLLSTGEYPWDIWKFITSGAEVITNPTQKAIFTYCKANLAKYSKKQAGVRKMTNRNVVIATLGKIPSEVELRKKKLDYDLRFKRYTNSTLEQLSELRAEMTKANLPATFIDSLGHYIKKSAEQGYFTGYNYNYDGKNSKWERDDNTETECFPMANGTTYDLYSDEHHTEFENSLRLVLNAIEQYCPDQDGYPSDSTGAKRLIEMNIYKGNKFAN